MTVESLERKEKRKEEEEGMTRAGMSVILSKRMGVCLCLISSQALDAL